MSKTIGYGTVVSLTSVSSGTTYYPVGRVRSLDGPSLETAEVECTTFDSTLASREFLLALKDPGSFTMELAYDPQDAGVQEVQAALTDRIIRSFKIVFPTTGHVISGDAYVNSFSPSIPVDDLVTASVGFRISGAVTWPSTV